MLYYKAKGIFADIIKVIDQLTLIKKGIIWVNLMQICETLTAEILHLEVKRKRESVEELMCHCWFWRWKGPHKNKCRWFLGADNSLRVTVLKETDLNLFPVRTSDLNHKELYLANNLNKLGVDSSPELSDKSPVQPTPWFQTGQILSREHCGEHLDFWPKELWDNKWVLL